MVALFAAGFRTPCFRVSSAPTLFCYLSRSHCLETSCPPDIFIRKFFCRNGEGQGKDLPEVP